MALKTLAVPKTYEDALDMLIEEHVEAHNDLHDLEIYLIPDKSKKFVKLIAVSDTFPETNDIWPFAFKESDDFPFKNATAIATKSEWRKILQGKLKFQSDWNLKNMKRVWPHDQK